MTFLIGSDVLGGSSVMNSIFTKAVLGDDAVAGRYRGWESEVGRYRGWESEVGSPFT